MSLIVQKYGGTSVGNPERIRNVARRVVATQEQGHGVVVVVSAMSGVTDSLIKLAKDVSPSPEERVLERHTEPQGATYRKIDRVPFPATLLITVFPDLALPPAGLFPA